MKMVDVNAVFIEVAKRQKKKAKKKSVYLRGAWRLAFFLKKFEKVTQ